jgi:hypothetical protein
MAEVEELKEAEERGFRRGLRIGRAEKETFRTLPAVGEWLPGIRLFFFRSWFFSAVVHRRRLIANLREVQRVRWLLDHEPDSVPEEASAFLADLPQLERDYEHETWDALFMAEELLDEGAGRASVVATMQATPQRPGSAVEYDDLRRFLEESPGRGAIYPTHVVIRPGAVYGTRWQLENPFRRWETTNWTIGWLCGPYKEMRERLADDPLLAGEADELDAKESHEIYAIESLDSMDPWAEDGRVWLLGTVRKRALVEEALREISRHAMEDRNSLVAAAEAVAAAQRRESEAL